ncbi:MAG TPA: DUF4337 domain-containing protein [Candidatus Saccharimonadales bacterium]|nr:DUF4337 domain-containing protein [Candidatus Saccharimonadales bacterium]
MHEALEGQEEHGGHENNPLMIPVAVTLSILAVLVAIATLLGHRAASEEILLQTKASDQWAYFQAKNIRLHEMESVADMFATLAPADKEKAEILREKYVKEAERYEKEKDQISDQAKELEKAREVAGKRADRFDAGEVVLEIALIICSLTLLTKKKAFWLSGIALGLVGLCVTVSGFLLH